MFVWPTLHNTFVIFEAWKLSGDDGRHCILKIALLPCQQHRHNSSFPGGGKRETFFFKQNPEGSLSIFDEATES